MFKQNNGTKNNFVVEYRVVPGHPLARIPCFGDWHPYEYYDTSKEMQEELERLKKKDQTLFEYREKL